MNRAQILSAISGGRDNPRRSRWAQSTICMLAGFILGMWLHAWLALP